MLARGVLGKAIHGPRHGKHPHGNDAKGPWIVRRIQRSVAFKSAIRNYMAPTKKFESVIRAPCNGPNKKRGLQIVGASGNDIQAILTILAGEHQANPRRHRTCSWQPPAIQPPVRECSGIHQVSRGGFPILFNHRSLKKKKTAVFPGILLVLWKEGSWKEWGSAP